MPIAPVFGAIEGRRNQFVRLIGSGPQDIRTETRIATTAPETTLRNCSSSGVRSKTRQKPLTPEAAQGLTMTERAPEDQR
jgi:hypothetical protein